jgi:diacylglycerol kinase family enzyme
MGIEGTIVREEVKQALVVYSPQAANPSYLDEVLGYITRRLCDIDFYNVRAIPMSEDSIACLLFAYEPLDLIVVAGGDKTTRCVLESLAQSRLQIPVGLVPLGGDTLLAAKLGIKPCHDRDDLDEALDVIAAGKTFAMDMGRVNGRYFAIDAVIGNIPPVVLAPESNISRQLGVLSHLTPFVQSMGTRATFYRFLEEDTGEGFCKLASSIFVTNARGVGAGAGNGVAELSDGYLYLCIVNPLKLSDYGRIAYRFGAWYLSGIVGGDAPFTIRKIKKLRIESERPQPAMVDGEIWGETPVDIDLVAGAVQVLVPQAMLEEASAELVEGETLSFRVSETSESVTLD